MNQTIDDFKCRITRCHKDYEDDYRNLLLYRILPLSIFFLLICLVIWLV